MLICHVVGARPNFMKIAPVALAFKRRRIPSLFVHTGQHYEPGMSNVFLEELGMGKPNVYLDGETETGVRQTAKIMIEFETVCREYRPDLVVVGGDVNSTLAVSLAASFCRTPIAHVEAGLRSFDRAMAEEINRIVTDHLSSLLFTTEESANRNLVEEGIHREKIHYVGNCMVDTLMNHVQSAVSRAPWRSYHLEPSQYALLTLHRPSNVDDLNTLAELIQTVGIISRTLPVLFPIHPRTQDRLTRAGILLTSSIHCCPPLPYLDFIGIMAKAKFVMTDSGGIQEETTALHIPCLTLRENTERPITLLCGTNRLVGADRQKTEDSMRAILEGKWPQGTQPPLWDGKASERIADHIEAWLSNLGKA